MSIFHKEKALELTRYFSNFGMEIDHAECFEALQAEDLTRDANTGERQPYVVEWYLVPGKVRDTLAINTKTLDDVWEVEKEASLELQVVVFKTEEEKQLYLQSKK